MVVREFATPITDALTFNLIVQSVITDNPFGCVGYISDGKNHDPVEKIKEVYTVRILYKDNSGTIVNSSEETFNSYSGYVSGVAAIPPMTQEGNAIHYSYNDTFEATLKCYGVNNEIYYVVFTRDDVILAAYSDDSIRMGFATWAYTVISLTAVKEKTTQKNSEPLQKYCPDCGLMLPVDFFSLRNYCVPVTLPRTSALFIQIRARKTIFLKKIPAPAQLPHRSRESGVQSGSDSRKKGYSLYVQLPGYMNLYKLIC